MYNKFKLLLLSLSLTTSACEDFVQIAPSKNELSSLSVYTNDETATAAMRGLYIQMMESNSFVGGLNSVNHLTGLSSDELKNYSASPEYVQFYSNNLVSNNSYIMSNLWQKPYAYIFQANSILEGVATSKGLTDGTKRQLEGEAKFIRAFFHFYLVNLFGDVPLITSTNYKLNSVATRTLKHIVYEQIIMDLKDAKNLMLSDYSMEGGERIRPNKWAATALLARVYLYTSNWINAEAQATEVINNSLYALVNLNSVFSKNSGEAIWQLMPTQINYNTFEGNFFIITSISPYVSLSDALLNVFEPNDARVVNWIGRYSSNGITWCFPYKYRYNIRSQEAPLNEYSMVLRLSEQYLIRGEARAHQDKITGINSAANDLNTIRSRAGLKDTSALVKEDMLMLIENERRVEFFTEWGHRWFDLKRWGKATEVLGSLKYNWSADDLLYPIPQSEINNNPNLKPQNSGY